MTKFALMSALFNGTSINHIDTFGNVTHFECVLGVEVESGSLRSFNVWGYNADGNRICVCMATLD